MIRLTCIYLLVLTLLGVPGCASTGTGAVERPALTEEGVVPPPAESIARASRQPSDVNCAARPMSDYVPPTPADSAPVDPRLLDPDSATKEAQDVFWVEFRTTAGPFVVRFERRLSPEGVDRIYNLVDMGFYDGVAFFRVIEGFMVQFGIHGDPLVSEAWTTSTLPDEPVVGSNRRGTVSYAKSASPDSRTVQLFINYADNSRLDSLGFNPIGEVVRCMSNVEAIYSKYGEAKPHGKGPPQDLIHQKGNEFLREEFPKLDYIIEVEFLRPPDDID